MDSLDQPRTHRGRLKGPRMGKQERIARKRSLLASAAAMLSRLMGWPTMPRRHRIAVVIAGLLVVVVGTVFAYQAWAAADYADHTLRFRRTVTVEVNGKQYSGSSVQEMKVWTFSNWATDRYGIKGSTWGEAVRIDIPEQAPIYVLLADGYGDDNYAYRTYAACGFPIKGNSPDQDLQQLVHLDHVCHGSVRGMPLTLRFSNPADPQSGSIVLSDGRDYPDETGVRFVDTTIERVSLETPLTTGQTADFSSWMADPNVHVRVHFHGLIYGTTAYELKREQPE